MTFDDVLAMLPNGLHDAELVGVHVDYAHAEASWLVRVDLSGGDGDGSLDYREARITFGGVTAVVIDPPEAVIDLQPLTGDAESGQPSTSPLRCMAAPPGGFVCWFFATELNAFLRIAARSARLDWLG